MATGRIRVSLSANEVEIEGDLDFVSKYDSTVDEMLKRIRNQKATAGEVKADASETPAVKTSVPATGEFGEVLQSFTNSASVTDQVLLAGSYAQASSDDNAFTTRQASQLLIEQGIKVGNPSQCMTNNLKAKRVFKVPGNKYRVSKQGVEHLKKLGG